jgi:hypothetical protein
MHKGGRPRDPIWEHFTEVESNGKCEAMCKTCGHKQSVKVHRMKDHFKTCNKSETETPPAQTPNSDSEAAQPQPSEHNQSSTNTSSGSIKSEGRSAAADGEGPGNKAQKRKVQPGIEQFACRTSSEAKNQLDIIISRFFYGCNIPFAVAEHELFKKMITALRPGYEPPSRKALADNLLDTVTSQLQTTMKTEVEGKDVTLVEDGWSNVHNDPVTATCVHVNGKSFFMKAADNGSEKKTAQYCKDQCSATMQEIEQKYGCKVRSIVTDNEKKMEKMKSLLQQDDDQLIVYGCSSHWLNLLGQELTPQLIMKHVVEVQKYFRNHHQPSGWLKELSDTVIPQLPGDTRWNSQLMCVDTFIRNHTGYTHVANSHEEEMDKNIVKLIRDYNLLKQVKDLSKQLRPVADALDHLQGDKVSIADACDTWLTLLADSSLQPHRQAVNARFKLAIQPVHYFAYMLHPKYKGSKLSAEQQEEARNWIIGRKPELLPFVIGFHDDGELYPRSFFAPQVVAKLDPVGWWKSMKRATKVQDIQELADVMTHLLSCPASSASVERVFSSFGLVHTKLRNRLGVERAAKLVFCYRMLRGNITTDDY